MAQGLLGVNFGKARFPDLNLIDATWVMAEGTSGPNAPYNMATRLNTLIASRDPIAADYYAGKHVLRPVSWWNGHPGLHDYGRMDPDNPDTENPGNGRNYSVDSTPCGGMPYNAFHQMLVSSRDKMLAYGKQVTMDTLQMTVHVFSFRRPSGIAEATKGRASALQLAARPDPTAGRVTVRYQLDSPQVVRVTVLDSDGRVVAHLFDAQQATGTHDFIWNRSDDSGRRLPAGTYLVRADTRAGRNTVKVVVGD
jgi:hypothetical protein